MQLWAPPYVSIAIGKWNPWWSRCHGDSLHSLTSAHLTSPLALSLSVCLSLFLFLFLSRQRAFISHPCYSSELIKTGLKNRRHRLPSLIYEHSMPSASYSPFSLLSAFFVPPYPIRASFSSFAVRFLFIQHSPYSRPLSHDSSTSFGSSFLSTFRQLDAFLTTRSTHPEGTTVELYSASTTTIVSSSVRWKADKQRWCKRAAPFHFCLTSNLLQHRLMKETWSDRPW